jgi:hypothetical protein
MTYESDGSPWYLGRIDRTVADKAYYYIHEPENGLQHNRLLGAATLLKIGAFMTYLDGDSQNDEETG